MNIEKKLNNDVNVAAFFDLDLTITNVDTFRAFLKRYYVHSPFKIHLVLFIFAKGLLRKLRLISLKSFKEAGLVGLKGMTKEQVLNLGDVFFNKYLKCHIRNDIIKEIKKHKSKDRAVYIVSASPDVYVRAIASYLNCDGYICTALEYENGIFSGKILGNDCIGVQKFHLVKQLSDEKNINLDLSYVYSDHEVDLPLLENIGNTIAVCPTQALRDISDKKGWLIVDW